MQCVKSGQISSVILESIRKSIIKRIKKIGKLYVFIFPNILLTKKPVGIRMGKGAGGANIWIYPVKAGKIILELAHVPLGKGLSALRAASFKLPMKSKIVIK